MSFLSRSDLHDRRNLKLTMANTEGLPDEIVEEMLSLPAPSAVTPAAAATSSTSASPRGAPASFRGRGPANSRAERVRRRDEAMKAQRERRLQQQHRLDQQQQVTEASPATAATCDEATDINATLDDASSPSSSSHEQRRQEQQARMESQPAFHLHPSRAQMMDNWNPEAGAAGGTGGPSATVVRSSRAPSIRSKQSNTLVGGDIAGNDTTYSTGIVRLKEEKQQPVVGCASKKPEDVVISTGAEMNGGGSTTRTSTRIKPVIKAQSIQERPVHLRSANMQQLVQAGEKKPSKFLQRRMQKQQQNKQQQQRDKVSIGGNASFIGGTAGGFPSLDVPIGTFARKANGKARMADWAGSSSRVSVASNDNAAALKNPKGTGGNGANDGRADAARMLAGMTPSEIRDGISEIESVLSEEAIAFLKSRGQKKKEAATTEATQRRQQNDSTAGSNKRQHKGNTAAAREIKNVISGNGAKADKEMEAAILSSIKTEDELDRAFADLNPNANTVLESAAPYVEAVDGQIQDLKSATALLRSTSHRQTLLAAKTASSLLAKRVADVRKLAGDDFSPMLSSDLEIPTILPVALRCLLDLPQPHKYQQLYVYVLQSIRSLVEFSVHPSHRVYMCFTALETHASSIYELDFMDDLPVPPVGSCYKDAAGSLSVAQKLDDSPVEGALYATNSSAESAKKDGEAFFADPLWTLLSRMRIIPCLARLVDSASGWTTSFPDEMLTSICSILAMLSLRSPGAACAIAQHTTLVPQLVELTLSPGNCDGGETKETFLVNPRTALSSLILLCTLARQSRTVASQEEPFASVISNLHAILGISAENEEELTVQRWSLILWRILLRYGLAVPHLPTFISLGTPHLTGKNETKYSLTCEYLTAFANICECAKIITRSSGDSIIRLTGDQADTLAMAGAWLSPHVQSCATFLKETASSTSSTANGNAHRNNPKLIAARIRFLLSYVAASGPSDILKLAIIEEETHGSETEKVDPSTLISVVSRRSCISSLDAVLSSGFVEASLRHLLPYTHIAEWGGSSVALRTSADSTNCREVREEARACSMIVSFVSLLSNVVNNDSIFDDGQGSNEEKQDAMAIANTFQFMVFSSLRSVVHGDKMTKINLPSLARSGWIDAAQYAVVKFLSCTPQIISFVQDKPELFLLQEMAFALIGRLKVGDEAMVAVLLSQDPLFATENFGGQGEASPLQAMLLRELCNSHRSQGQLDHSFKLHRGHGITTAGKGPFGLESLRSEADFVATARKTDDSGDESESLSQPIVPLGKCWLWQVLSSTISPPPEASQEQRTVVLNDAASVIVSALELLWCMESKASVSSDGAPRVLPGTKMYHLCNCCLFPEEVLRHEKFQSLFSTLFAVVSSPTQTQHISMAKAYAEACFEHSQTANKARRDEHDAEKEKLLALFGDKTGSSDIFTAKEIIALVDFIGDLCNAYTEYGAQYEALNHCMRFLLRPGFPAKARVEVLIKLRGLLHLLTFPSELSDLGGDKITADLQVALSIPSKMKEGSPLREPVEVLDAFADILSYGGMDDNARQLDAETGGFVYFLAIAQLARNYAESAMYSDDPGFEEATKKRLDKINGDAKANIFEVSNRLKESNLTDETSLVNAVLDVFVQKVE